MAAWVTGAQAAEMLPLRGFGDWQFACCCDHGVRLGGVCESGKIRLLTVSERVTGAAAAPGLLHLFAGREWQALDPGAMIVLRRTLPAEVREAVGLQDGRLLAITGGSFRGPELLGGRVAVLDPHEPEPSPAEQVKPAWDPYFLNVSPLPHPLFAGQPVLVAVRKSAHFDRLRRSRPFLFRYVPARKTLQPVWKGTSYSRPFVDTLLADVTPEPGPEAAALEVLTGGRKALRVYTWTGACMEAVADGPAGGFGETLRALQPAGEEREALVVMRREAGRLRALLLRPGNKKLASGVMHLQIVSASPWLSEPVLAWVPVAAGEGKWIVTCGAGGRLRAWPLKGL